jgi:hypothetical protein
MRLKIYSKNSQNKLLFNFQLLKGTEMKIKAPLILTLAILICLPLLAQEKKIVKDRSKDAFEEAQTGNLTLRFFNALNGKEIEGASVTIQGSGDYTTDFEGKVVFPPPQEDGFYKVSFRADGFVPSDFDIEITAGTIFFNRFSISPVMDLKFLRVVVDWDKTPQDLDAHFVKEGEYHISYRHMKTTADGQAQLDRDCTTGYGPETITCTLVSSTATYEYFMHDFTNRSSKTSKKLSDSKAMVKVFAEGKLLRVFRVPQDKIGNVWRVFKVHQGTVNPIDAIVVE